MAFLFTILATVCNYTKMHGHSPPSQIRLRLPTKLNFVLNSKQLCMFTFPTPSQNSFAGLHPSKQVTNVRMSFSGQVRCQPTYHTLV